MQSEYLRLRREKALALHRLAKRIGWCACVILAAFSQVVSAAPSRPDPSFGGSGTGIVITAFTTSTNVGGGQGLIPPTVALAIQPDGKPLLASTCSDSGFVYFCALRYTRDGVIDTSFSGDGKVLTAVTADSDYATAVAIQADGNIVLAGGCGTLGNFAFCATRYLPNGTLDASFGSGGKVVTPMGSGGFASGVAIQPDGKIVVAGPCQFSGIAYLFACAVRYLPNGLLDPDFGFFSKIYDATAIPSAVMTEYTPVAFRFALALQPDGKILLGAGCEDPAAPNLNGRFCVFRHLNNGDADISFGSGGKFIASVTGDVVSSITLQPDGKILLVGGCYYGSTCLLRLDPDGVVELFASTAEIPGYSNLTDPATVSMQSNGQVLLAGPCAGSTNFGFCTLRLNDDGSRDLSFGDLGTGIGVIEIANLTAYPTAVAVQSDGKIVVAGACVSGPLGNVRGDFCAVRYQGGPFGYKSCSLDVDGDGLVRADTDMLIGTRIALGITGTAVVNGITFATEATRMTWPLIRDYLVTQCGLSLVQ